MIGKAAMLRLHKYFGLAAAAFLLVQALTGLTLVYGPQLAQLIDPSGMTSGPGRADAAPARLVAAAEALYPAYHVDRLVYPAEPDGTYLVHMADSAGEMRYVSLDRHGARVLRVGTIWHFPIVAALNIHDRWLSGTAGTLIVSLAGLILLFMAGSGLAFWWPRRGRVMKSLAVQRRLAPRLVLRQLHRSTGVLASALLIFMALTGLFVAIPMVLDGTARPWSATEPVSPSIDAAVDLAIRQFPGHSIRDVRVPGPGRLDIFLFAPERNSMAVHRVAVDPRAPHILSVRNAFDDRAPWVIALPLHSGKILGGWPRLIVVIAGLLLVALAATGPVMWYQARRARRGSKGRALFSAPVKGRA